MKRLTYPLVALPLVLLLLVLAVFPAIVLAINNTPDTAIVLTPQNPSQAGQLVGDTGGAVLYYRFDYPIAGQAVKIDLTAIPGMNTTGPAFGFKLYGPNGLVGEAPVEENQATFTRYALTLNSTTLGSYLIQVFNFTAGITVNFNLQTSGLAGPPGTPVPGPPPGSSPANPIAISQPFVSIGGSLLGQVNGQFMYFSFEYPGASSPLSIQLKYSPPSPFINNAIGFNLYRAGSLAGQGSEIQRDGGTVTVAFTLVDDAGQPYLLQVFNYQPNLQISFVLTVSGASGPVQQATGNVTPDKALALTVAAPAARGVIQPQPGLQATFNYFLFTHPGGNVPVTVSLTVDPQPGISRGMVGFNLYKGATLAGQGIAVLNSRGDKWVAYISVIESSPVTYGLQVFNYSQAQEGYSLYTIGLR
ncbi:MAG: hypothetical protein M1358_21225 [Chloroflexi bacterium]|nr:hypothetical protein [Chloroflexota bacterium]